MQRGCFRRSIAAFSVGAVEVPLNIDHFRDPAWPAPIGRLIHLEELEQGLEVTLILEELEPDQNARLAQFLALPVFLSLGFVCTLPEDVYQTAHTRYADRESKAEVLEELARGLASGRPYTYPTRPPLHAVRDGLVSDIAFTHVPAQGSSAVRAHCFDTMVRSAPQRLHFAS